MPCGEIKTYELIRPSAGNRLAEDAAGLTGFSPKDYHAIEGLLIISDALSDQCRLAAEAHRAR